MKSSLKHALLAAFCWLLSAGSTFGCAWISRRADYLSSTAPFFGLFAAGFFVYALFLTAGALLEVVDGK